MNFSCLYPQETAGMPDRPEPHLDKPYNDKTIMLKYIPHSAFLIMSLFATHAVIAQSTPGSALSGTVRDAGGQPVPFATVALRSAKDSGLVKGTVTDEQGHYAFGNTPAGDYLVCASMIGMEKACGSIHVPPIGQATMAALTLKPSAARLKGIDVKASKPFIQHEIDKTIVNVENSIVSAGNSAWEILQKSPGVTVDNAHNSIGLQGKSGVVIYLDGKPTHLSGDQLAGLLKSMSAETIARIEILTQPSAKYDAAGNAGIINIVTRKSRLKGLSGSLTTGYTRGKYGRGQAGGNISYRTGKVNLFGNYDFGKGTWWNDNDISRNFYDGDGKTLSTRTLQYSSNTFPFTNHDFKAGADIYLNDKHTLGVMVNGMIHPGDGTTENTTWFLNPDGSTRSTSLTRNTMSGRWTNMTYDLNYQGHLDSTGRELDADLAYSRFDNRSHQGFHTDAVGPDGTPLPDTPESPNPNIRQGSLPSIIDIRTAKLDYTQPLPHGGKLELGAKYSLVTSDNNVRYQRLDNPSGQWMPDSASNHFKYTENINALYANLHKEFSHGWGLQLGLRGEQTVSKGHQYTNDSTVRRNYIQLFPSVFISKKLDSGQVLNLSYSRRVDRPDYQDLNPFRYYLDPYIYAEGNPFLQPQLTHSVSLKYLYKSLLSVGLSYAHTEDVMSQVLRQDDSTLITYQTQENLSRLDNVGLDISLTIPVTRWWMSNNSINVYHNIYDGEFLDAHLHFGKTAYTFHSMNTFTLPWNMKAELSGYYNSPMLWSIFTIRPQYMVSAGLEKTFWKQKASLKLNVSDLFKTQYSHATVKYQNLDVSALNHWDSRTVALTFTYRFSHGEAKPAKNHQSAILEEQSRIKK